MSRETRTVRPFLRTSLDDTLGEAILRFGDQTCEADEGITVDDAESFAINTGEIVWAPDGRFEDFKHVLRAGAEELGIDLSALGLLAVASTSYIKRSEVVHRCPLDDGDTDGDPRDDPGFWRYLSLAYFWEFIAWRESRAFARGNFEKYVDGMTSPECVLTRMYTRGASVGGLDHLESAEAVRGTDFWRSHVLRVRTGTAPPVVRALVEMQETRPLERDDLREFAKALTRTWANVVPAIYDDEDAGALISELREELFPAGAG